MRKLTVVGMGPGSQSCLTLEALEALRKADLIVGAGRLLETLPEGCTKNRKIAVSAQAVCDAVYGSDSSFPCVVCTGDTGCYSLCTGLGKYWDGELSILPGIGSMSYLAAKLQLPWQDWKVVSAHGRACDPVAAVTENPEVFFLTGPDNTAQELCRQLMQAGFGGCRAYVGEAFLSGRTDCVRNSSGNSRKDICATGGAGGEAGENGRRYRKRYGICRKGF